MTKNEDPDILSKRDYFKGIIEYEGVLGTHLTHVAQYRDLNPRQYASSIETLILMCPKGLRNKGLEKLTELGLKRCDYDGMAMDKMLLYDKLWVFMNELLEDSNLIFKTGSFEIGRA